MKGSYINRGILLGILTSVIVIVLAFGIAQATGLVFPPFRLFDFVSRMLPGAVITFVIDTMVGAITSLNLGQTSAVSKLVEQSLALLEFVILGGIFGLALGYVAAKTDLRRLPTWGALIGLVLLLGFVLVEMSLASAEGTSLSNLAWQALMFGGWGAVLGWLLRESTLAARETPANRKMSRREMLLIGGTALGAIVLSAAGLGFFFYNRENEKGIPVTGPTPPPDERFANRIEPAPGRKLPLTRNSIASTSTLFHPASKQTNGSSN